MHLWREYIKIALSAIRGNMLRAVLTMVIIAVGITALVGILTAIDAIKGSINSNFTSMGANTFTIRNREMSVRIGKGGKRPQKYKPISYDDARRFKETFLFPAKVGISMLASMGSTLKYRDKETNPNIAVFGGDESYLAGGGYEIDNGRNFSSQEIFFQSPVILLGSEVAAKLFPGKTQPLDKVISVGASRYKVIGVLKSKGASMTMGGDKICIIPVSNARARFAMPDISYTINVVCRNPQELEIAVGEATGRFRTVRALRTGQEDNFEILKSDSIAGLLIENIKYVTMAATIIGIITLLGAAIGLMNIMLVSVSERTREIGVRKSLGASSAAIRFQFLTEAVVICQMGGILGIILGMITGNITSFFVGSGFIVPWFWIGSGVLICLFVGIVAGYYPASRAAGLDPVEALRYE
jgi:putative ABC transport system permease protein